jgi:AraC-like DNA-binding protein
LGGVSNYVQEQRLGRAYAELSNPARDHRRIYEVAFDVGFSSEAHFSRAFRSMFGLSPSDVRARARTVLTGTNRQPAPGLAEGGYEAWVRQLRP